jgi:uncharacterized membrane protein YbhN (UPF0104 family)
VKALSARNRQLILRGFGTLAAIVLIVVLIREEGWNEVVEAFTTISWVQISLALILVFISRFFVVLRWYILLRSGGVPISFSRALALVFTGLFASNFLPTTIGGDVVRLAGAMQIGYDRAVCLASIAADRLLGMLGMVLALPFGLPAVLGLLDQDAALPMAAALWVQRGWSFLKRTFQTFSIWINQPLALLLSLGCSIGHMLCTFAALYVLITGLGEHVSFWLIGGLWSVAYFISLVPVSINGYGVQELTLPYPFSTAGGLGATVSLTIAILIRVLYMLASLPGAVSLQAILAAMDTEAAAQK